MNFTRIFLPLLLINFFLSVPCTPMKHDDELFEQFFCKEIRPGLAGVNVNGVNLIINQILPHETEDLLIRISEVRDISDTSLPVTIEIKNNVLHLWKNSESNQPVTITLSIKSLSSINISRNGSVQLGTGTNVQLSSLDINISDNGKLTAQHLTTTIQCTITVKDNGIVEIPDLHTYRLHETVTDKGSITIKGYAEHQTINASDSAQINQQGLTGKAGSIILKNAAVAHLNIQHFFTARVEDDRKLTNHGNGQVMYADPDKNLWYMPHK